MVSKYWDGIKWKHYFQDKICVRQKFRVPSFSSDNLLTHSKLVYIQGGYGIF